MEMSVKQKVDEIKLSSNEFLLPLFEVIVNALNSVEDVSEKGIIKISIERDKDQKQMFDDSNFSMIYPIKRITVTDNGCGFNDLNFKSFNQAYSTYNMHKGCKGVGRFTVLACFKKMGIKSIYKQDGKFYERTFTFDKTHEVKGGKQAKEIAPFTNNKTEIVLENYYPTFYHKSNISTQQIIDKLVEHCLLFFLSPNPPKIMYLDDQNNDTAFKLVNDDATSLIQYDKDVCTFKINKEQFELHLLKENSKKQNSLIFCANKRQVGKTSNLTKVLPGLDTAITSGDKKYYISAYITGDYLDKKVNSVRNSFNIAQSNEDKDLDDKLTFEEVYTEIEKLIEKLYADHILIIEKQKHIKIAAYILNKKNPRFEYKYLLDEEKAFKSIPSNASADKIEEHLHRISFEIERVRKKRIKQIIAKKGIDEEDFSDEFKRIMSQETLYNKNRLADLIMRRKAIICLMRRFLNWDKDKEYKLEQDLHNIIFTMGSDSKSTTFNNHNLWLLDERLSFHTYAASDKKPRTNPDNIESSCNKEPDLMIFDKTWAYFDDPDDIKSLVVFEFKRPGLDIPAETKLEDLILKYFVELDGNSVKDSNGGKIEIGSTTPKFGYIICNVDKKLKAYNKNWNEFKETPYNTLFKLFPEQNLYIEVLTFKQLLDNAEKKHMAFFKALGVES